MDNNTNKLTVSRQKELEEWSAKIKDGEADGFILDWLNKKFQIPCDPKYILHKVAKDIMPRVYIKGERVTDNDLQMIGDLLTGYGLDTDFSVLESIEEKYRGLIINLRRELIKEYNCKTHSEKALVDIIVIAYARNLTISRMLTFNSTLDHTTPNLNSFLSVMSKEVDRANRHFITALETLRQIKQPQIKLNVKANNAFLGQNQQFNNNQNKSDEVVEAK